MTKVNDSVAGVEYLVETLDFGSGENWEPIGTLKIGRGKADYIFEMSATAQHHKVLPPEIYGLEEGERKKLIDTRYREFGWGAWSMRIHQWAVRFIKEKSFPETYPEIYAKRSGDAV
jgi:hypothetical protein